MLKEIVFPSKFTGYHMLGIITLFFGTIIAVNLTLAFYAAGSWTGLVVKNTYVESQLFEEKKSIRRSQIDLGWVSDASYREETFNLHLNAADGAPIIADKIEANFGRPTYDRDDVTLELHSSGRGQYGAEIILDPGIWQVDIDVYQGHEIKWTKSVRLLVGG